MALPRYEVVARLQKEGRCVRVDGEAETEKLVRCEFDFGTGAIADGIDRREVLVDSSATMDDSITDCAKIP